MGMPSITVRFIEKAATAVKRGSRGTVGLILRGSAPSVNPAVITTENDIVGSWSNANKQYIKDTLMGYVNKPQKVLAYFVPAPAAGSDDSYADALTYFSKVSVDYIACPTVTTDSLASSIVSWVKDEWDNKHYVIAVLPDYVADYEGIVNFATDDIVVGEHTYTIEQYTPRIAGLLAGTPLNMSATYAPLAEVDDVEKLTKAQRDSAVDAGKFILYFDGEKVKVGRAVTSLTTTSSTKGDQFKKVHLIDIMRVMATDIKTTVEDGYIGKYPNSYDNKVLLMCAIRAYIDEFVRLEYVAKGYTLDIDVEANAAYLTSKGKDVSKMTEDEIRKAQTGDKVFLVAHMQLIDTMEDFDLPIYI